MPVPEAAVNLYDFFAGREDDIRATGELAILDPEPVAHAMQHRADEKLGLRVLAPDLGHVPGSLLWGQSLRHLPLSGQPLDRWSRSHSPT